MRRIYYILFVVISTVKFGYSQEKDSLEILLNQFKLEEVVVTGDLLDRVSTAEIKNFVGSRSVVELDQNSLRGNFDVTDNIKLIPGLIANTNSGTGGNGSALNIGVRGLSQRLTARSTVMLDGVPLAVAPYGQPQLSMAPVSMGVLQSIDVVRGGGAVRYGPQNVGGIINFVTKKLPKKFTTEIGLNSSYYNSTATDLEFGNIDGFIGGGIGDNTKLGLLYSGHHGSTWRGHSRQDFDNVILKGEHKINDNHKIYGRLLYYNANSDSPGGLTVDEYREDAFQSTRPYDKFRGNRKEGVVGYEGKINSTIGVSVSAFYNESFREFVFAKGSPSVAKRMDSLPRNYKVFGISPRITKLFRFDEGTVKWSVGYRYVNEDTNEKRYRRSHPAGDNPYDTDAVLNRYSKNTTNAHAAFTDFEIRFGKFQIVPGVRMENVTITRENMLPGHEYYESVHYSEFLPSLGVNYAINDEFSVFGAYNRSFGGVQHLQLNLQEKGNVLKPELANTYELGLKAARGTMFGEFTLYYIDFTNQLVYDSDAEYWSNRGATKHYGVEFAVSAFLTDHVKTYGNYTLTNAIDDGENKGNVLEFVSQHHGLAGIGYYRDKFSVYGEFNAYSSQYSDPKNTEVETADGSRGIIPGYGIVKIGATYDIGQHVTISGGVKNLFDNEYFTRSTDALGRGKLIGEPRTVFFAARIKI